MNEEQLDLSKTRSMTSLNISETLDNFYKNPDPKITKLRFDYSSLDLKNVKKISKILNENKSIKNIKLFKTKIQKDHLELLKDSFENCSLTSIDLGSNNFESKGFDVILEGFENNKTIEELHVSWNDIITPDMKKFFSSNHQLKILSLVGNKISGNGCKMILNSFLNNHSLHTLDLMENLIDEIGMKYISKLLEENDTLTDLNLRRNKFNSISLEYLSNGLKKNSTLKILNLSFCDIDYYGIKAFSEFLKENKYLNTLKMNENMINNKGFQYFAECLQENCSLTSLDLAFNDRFSSKSVSEFICENDTLEELNVAGNQWDQKDFNLILEGLENNRSLISLVETYKKHLIEEDMEEKKNQILTSNYQYKNRKKHFNCNWKFTQDVTFKFREK